MAVGRRFQTFGDGLCRDHDPGPVLPALFRQGFQRRRQFGASLTASQSGFSVTGGAALAGFNPARRTAEAKTTSQIADARGFTDRSFLE